MAEIVEEVADVTKPFVKNKKIQKYLPALIVIAGVGAYFYFKNRNKKSEDLENQPVTEVPPTDGISTNTSALEGDSARQYINDALKQNNEIVSQAFGTIYDSMEDYQKKLDAKIEQLNTQDSLLYDRVSEVSTKPADTIPVVPIEPKPVNNTTTISTQTYQSTQDYTGLYQSQYTKSSEISAQDKTLLSNDEKLYSASISKAREIDKQIATTKDTTKKAELTKQAQQLRDTANNAHTHAEEIRSNYGFSGGVSGDQNIKVTKK